MDFSEQFTRGVRDVLRHARRRRLVWCFDYSGPRVTLSEVDNGVSACIHRLALGIIDCFEGGFVMFTADVGTPADGRVTVMVHAAGTGATSRDAIQRVLQRLDLHPDTTDIPPDGRLPRAEGVCPATGGRTQFVDAGADGLVLSLEWSATVEVVESGESPPDAAGARAWLVSPVHGVLGSLEQRLRRLGWTVNSYKTLDRAAAALRNQLRGEAPVLLIVGESSGEELSMLASLAAERPAMWTVLAVVVGSPTLSHRGGTGVDIRTLPLSPAELDRFTAHVDWRTSNSASRDTAPGPLYVRDVRRVMVVDDSLVNQVVARGQLEALGYDVCVATDGAEALEACRAWPPDMVLMDLDMPVMGGLEATKRLRWSQATGSLPPFPIVAATSGDTERAECARVGMDGFLSKPMDLDTLAGELERLLPSRPAALDR